MLFRSPDNKPKTVRRPRLKLPFDNRKEDAGVWAYDHRIGLCVTIIAYLVLMIAFVSSKIVVGRRPHTQGMFIDLQTLAELEKELALLANTEAAQLDTTLLIHPQVMTDFLDYHFFLAEADALLRNNGYDGVFQIASLHPQYEFAGSYPDDIANFTNRSPCPTLHLLREDSIDKAVEAYPEAAMIYERNMQTLEDMGLEAWLDLDLGPRCPITGRTLNTPNEEK